MALYAVDQNGNRIMIAGAGTQGPKGDTGPQGPEGPQGPVGPAGADGAGVPDGGNSGQVLTKKSSANQDTQWAAMTAAQVSFTPPEGMTSTNVQGAVSELFPYVSEGKALIASAVTDQGVPTAADASFQTMHDNILKIETGSGFGAPLVVTTPPGATVTAVNGSNTVTAVSDGTATMILPAPGTWTVTSALDGKQKSELVLVSEGYAVQISLASRLPDGYTEVEYIQSSGTQYINTGFNPTNNTRVVADFKFMSISNSVAIFGARISARDRTYQFLSVSGKYRSDYNTEYTQIWESINALSRNIVDKNKETTTVGGESKSYTNSAFQCGIPLYLFCSNSNGSRQFNASAQLYSCQIYGNGTLVRDFVPCKNPSGAVGLYDLVGAQFYANAGTGTFTAGPIA